MTAPKLPKNGIIGIVCPSHIGNRERYDRNIYVLESLGFRVKIGANVFRDTYGYSASEQERADDFNQMVHDDDVNMILFGGGEGGGELLPYIDYDGIRRHPKLMCSFSDGTTILNAVRAKTGLTTYYGQGPGMFYDLRHYDYRHFTAHFLEERADTFLRDSLWKTLHPGVCEGTLLGGYTRNFALLLGSEYFAYDESQSYILFLEDHEKFSKVAKVSAFLSHIEQHPFIRCVTGLIFGHYSRTDCPDLLGRLERFGEKHQVPVVYCDDFGHGDSHGIFPIGGRARLDATAQTLDFLSE